MWRGGGRVGGEGRGREGGIVGIGTGIVGTSDRPSIVKSLVRFSLGSHFECQRPVLL